MDETFAEEVERRKPEREDKPESCSHCGFETTELTNYSRTYGGNVGGHWLCKFCEVTNSASALGAGNYNSVDKTTQDVAAMLHVLEQRLGAHSALNNGSDSQQATDAKEQSNG